MMDFEVVKLGEGKFATQVNKKWDEVTHKQRHLAKLKLQQQFEAGAMKSLKEDAKAAKPE